MRVKELKALLENVIDDLPILIIKDGAYIELTEDDIDIITFDGGKFVGPTVLLINIEDDEY